jgi:hypothetical protein
MPVLARKPGALRTGAPFNLCVLRRKLASAAVGNWQMVDILARRVRLAKNLGRQRSGRAILDQLGALRKCGLALPDVSRSRLYRAEPRDSSRWRQPWSLIRHQKFPASSRREFQRKKLDAMDSFSTCQSPISSNH